MELLEIDSIHCLCHLQPTLCLPLPTLPVDDVVWRLHMPEVPHSFLHALLSEWQQTSCRLCLSTIGTEDPHRNMIQGLVCGPKSATQWGLPAKLCSPGHQLCACYCCACVCVLFTQPLSLQHLSRPLSHWVVSQAVSVLVALAVFVRVHTRVACTRSMGNGVSGDLGNLHTYLLSPSSSSQLSRICGLTIAF